MEPLRIVVVDDEPAQRELIGGFLKKQGHEVFLAASGPEALARRWASISARISARCS